jgi:hypothetical protein
MFGAEIFICVYVLRRGTLVVLDSTDVYVFLVLRL